MVLARALERGLKDSGAVDLEALVVLAGRSVWALRLDVHARKPADNPPRPSPPLCCAP